MTKMSIFTNCKKYQNPTPPVHHVFILDNCLFCSLLPTKDEKTHMKISKTGGEVTADKNCQNEFIALI